MRNLYLLNGISKQAHFEALQRQAILAEKAACYVGFIAAIRELHPGMGLRKIYTQFQPEGIGRDAFIALGLSEGYRLRSVGDKPHRTTYSVKNTRFRNLLVGQVFTDVNQVWVSDIFYFPLQNRHYYVVLILDVYSRKLLGYSVADNLRAENNLRALQMALTLRGVSDYHSALIHHSDRGSQYVSNDYTDTLEAYGIRISMCLDVLENAHCERANGIIKNEYLNRWLIRNYAELRTRVQEAAQNYNNRYHNSIKMTPNEYEIYLQSIPKEKRNKLQIFTFTKGKTDPSQLDLFKI
jgi:putative transposase